MDPQNLIDKLRVVGIEKWEVMQTNVAYMKKYPEGQGVEVLASGLARCGASDDCYVIKMTVDIENSGTANVFFKDPQLDVCVVQLDEQGEVMATGMSGKTELYRGTNAPMSPTFADLGMARLVVEDRADWEPIAAISCPQGSEKAKESQVQFEILVGSRDWSHAQLMLDAFNIMNTESRKWILWLRGTAKVGSGRASLQSTAMVIPSSPVEISLKSKPALQHEMAFPK
jgi:hypothetical protein